MRTTVLTFGFVFLLFIIGCTSTTEESTQSSNTSDISDTNDYSVHEITNAILSNRSANCADYASSYIASVKDIQNNRDFDSSLDIHVVGNKCTFEANNIPNHDFNDASAHFMTDVSTQAVMLQVSSSPVHGAVATAISLEVDNAILLNGVKIDLLAAECYQVALGGCHDIGQPWRYDPMSPLNNFGTDAHNAHTQPTGAYHYHGNPLALFDTQGASESPVIGFAADGYPVFGSYIEENGTVRKVTSSYRLKSGQRIAQNGINPGGSYDGTFRDDYEYVQGLGDLDECNGMMFKGSYGYYVTDSFPYVIACYKGTPDSSFKKNF